MKKILITGSSGLIGGECVQFFSDIGYRIIGVDNDMRSYFFGSDASTKENEERLKKEVKGFISLSADVSDIRQMKSIFEIYGPFSMVIHAAAQPSHDWAAKEPLTDFNVNAVGTLNLLELTRKHCPDATFIFLSTNKLYGDRPNSLDLTETKTRFDWIRVGHGMGSIDETMSIDHCKHSVFGASKVAADIMCQEYGRYFGMKTGIFRCGCLTGPNHAGTKLHGFLSYLVKCIIHDKPYTIFGYKGKQVRDNLHSEDLARAFLHFHLNPKCGEVYNMGGGRGNDCSILEAIEYINDVAGTNWKNYTISPKAREGDHIWYISDLSKFKRDYPKWKITKTLRQTIKDVVKNEKIIQRSSATS